MDIQKKIKLGIQTNAHQYVDSNNIIYYIIYIIFTIMNQEELATERLIQLVEHINAYNHFYTEKELKEFETKIHNDIISVTNVI